MAELTPNLAMDYLLESQASGEVTHNNALNVLDALVQGKVKTNGQNTPTGSEVDGEGWIIGDSPTGVFVGHEQDVTFYYAGYIFWDPWEGMRFWVEDENLYNFYDGNQWVQEGTGWHNLICCVEATPVMEDPSGAAIPLWSAVGPAIGLGDYCYPTTGGHYVFECVVAGTEGTEPAWPTTLGEDIASGPNTLVWRARGLNVMETSSDLSGHLKLYEAIRYTVDGNMRHGIIKSVTASRIFIIGAPLWADTDMTTVEHALDSARVVQISFDIPGNYNAGGDTTTLLADVLDMQRRWRRPDASIVSFTVRNKTNDTGESPHINLWLGAAEIIAEGDSPEPGIQVNTTVVTHHEVAIHGESGTVNQADWGNVFELGLDHVGAGNNDDAVGLTAEVTLVLN